MSRALSMLMAVGLVLGISLWSATMARASGGPACPDLNDDGQVMIADIFIEGTYMGQTVPPAPAQTDMNKDGVVNNDDLAYFSPPLLPSPQWIALCQTSPIGPKGGPVGGTATAPLVANVSRGSDAQVVISPIAALVAVAGLGAVGLRVLTNR